MFKPTTLYEFEPTRGRTSGVVCDPLLQAFMAPPIRIIPATDTKPAKPVTLADDLEDFPTNPWIGRALCDLVLGGKANLGEMSCLEPACNRMYLADALWEYFGSVRSTDLGGYGYGGIRDFLDPASFADGSFDWVITNPPFSLIPEFGVQAMRVARRGVAFIVTLDKMATADRWTGLYRDHPYSFNVVLTERPGWTRSLNLPDTKSPKDWVILVWDKVGDPNVTRITHLAPGTRAHYRREDEDSIVR